MDVGRRDRSPPGALLELPDRFVAAARELGCRTAEQAGSSPAAGSPRARARTPARHRRPWSRARRAPAPPGQGTPPPPGAASTSIIRRHRSTRRNRARRFSSRRPCVTSWPALAFRPPPTSANGLYPTGRPGRAEPRAVPVDPGGTGQHEEPRRLGVDEDARGQAEVRRRRRPRDRGLPGTQPPRTS